MLRALLPALVLVGCATTPSASSSPAMADLRALDQQQNYAEMLGRLKDVAPAQRDAEWETLAEKANVAALEKLEITDGRSGESALMVIDDQFAAFPSLKKSPTYLQKRADVGAKAFGWTYGNYRHSTGDEQWVPKVKKFAEADAVTKGLAQRLAKDVVLGRLVASSAWPLYELAFQRDGDAVCADAKLVDVVIDVIDYESWLDEMTTLVTKRCPAQLKKPVAEKLKKNDSKSFRKGACKVLAGQADVGDALKVCEG
ncbi:MAG: hypothetical protein MUC96_35260 [Myxococcaceae bacterium]|nr:hypothetical protein [Myxococcaceae bacterium]